MELTWKNLLAQWCLLSVSLLKLSLSCCWQTAAYVDEEAELTISVLMFVTLLNRTAQKKYDSVPRIHVILCWATLFGSVQRSVYVLFPVFMLSKANRWWLNIYCYRYDCGIDLLIRPFNKKMNNHISQIIASTWPLIIVSITLNVQYVRNWPPWIHTLN